MKIKVNNKSLTRCLETVTKALAQKPIIPIHSNILFVIKDNSCSLYAQNGTLQIKGIAPVESEGDINMCIPGNIFMNTIRLLNEEELILYYKEEGFILQIIAGNKKYKITGVNPKDYTIHEVKGDSKTELKVPAQEFVKYMKTVSSIIKWDDIRPEIAGVTMLVNNGKIDITGTHDAFFFYRCASGFETDKEFAVVLHKEISLTVGTMRGSGDANIVIGVKSISITLDGFELTSTLVDVAKPLIIEKYIVYNKDNYIIANKQDLLMATRRSMNYSSNGLSLVVDIDKDEMKFSAENEFYGVDSEDVIDVENNNIESSHFGINMKYLMAILQNVADEKVKIFISGPTKPIYIVGNDTTDANETWGCCLMHINK